MAVPRTAPTPVAGVPVALVPTWLLSCYFLIVVVGGVVANVLLLATAVGWRCWRGRGRTRAVEDAVVAADEPGRDRGWWLLLSQLAATDAVSLALVSGGELWSVRETGGPWRLPGSLCAPFVGLEAMLGAAQTYLLVALALHARAVPADPVPSLSAWRHVSRSAVVPSALVWMLASSVAVPRTFMAVAVWPRPSLPLCTLLATSPTTGALEGPLDVLEVGAPGVSGSWWPLAGGGGLAADRQGGGPLLAALVLCAAPTLVLLATAAAAALSAARARRRRLGHRDHAGDGGDDDGVDNEGERRLARRPKPVCPPHKLARREWVRLSSWLSLSWLLLSLPRLASAAAHGFLLPGPGPGAFRAPPLGSRALGDASLLALSMLHYALTAARPVVAVLVSPALRRAALALVQGGRGHGRPEESGPGPPGEEGDSDSSL
ncbi:Mu-type opioid receptor [Frankliniella fusca]|uniref:Mu-type opioid receptor n=1 Tax=Frankliniella fusca TaxID=407009 RepID=A0AAE1GSP1_9NEOP|nr:Mu-type opioid receptor [Frankliniella fusca]